MISIDTATKKYVDAMRTARGRHQSVRAQAADVHGQAIARATSAFALAKKAADEKLLDAQVAADIALPRALADATSAFDSAARRASGAPEGSFIRDDGPTRLQVFLRPGVPAVGTAVSEGPDKWIVDGPVERKFFGSAVAARLELWAIAAAVPMPMPAA